MAKVKIPTPLRKFTNNESEITVEGSTVKELIENLEKSYPGIKKRLCDESGGIRKFINIYVGEDDIRFLKKEETELKKDSEVNIVPAIAGG